MSKSKVESPTLESNRRFLTLSLMADDHKEVEEDKDSSLSSPGVAGDATSGPALAFQTWLSLVRWRCRKIRFQSVPADLLLMPAESPSCEGLDIKEPDGDSINFVHSGKLDLGMNLWERLGNAAVLDIESSDFSWGTLSSLHHTEHSSSNDQSDDDTNKALEVTVNSGGVVFFAIFNTMMNNDLLPNEATAVIKIASSRMATQSERLGYEFAKWLGVRAPQVRVVYNSSPEWDQIKDATEKARDSAITAGDDVGELTCKELLEALELSRCLLFMNYIHGSPLLECSKAFSTLEAAKNTAAALGRVFMLDLILRNEDRLACHQLGWRGNPANLLFVEEVASTKLESFNEIYDSSPKKHNLFLHRKLQKERRAISMVQKLDPKKQELLSPCDSFNELNDSDKRFNDYLVMAIDSGVPRRPPTGKRAMDQECYPKVVELILNNSKYSANLLCEISGGKLGHHAYEEITPTDISPSLSYDDMAAVAHEFRGGFRSALRDLQSFHIFLLTLYQKLEGLLRVFLSIISKNTSEYDRDVAGSLDSPSHSFSSGFSTPLSTSRESIFTDAYMDSNDYEKVVMRHSSSGCRECSDTRTPISRENWNGRHTKGSGDHTRSSRMTMKLREFSKFAKLDAELRKELDHWNGMLRSDVIKLCQENNFNTGFFEGNDSTIVVDAYELKVRLEHILERIALISDASNTERPSHVSGNLFIGGALAARSVHTLQHLGITHVVCLCSNEIGQSESQYPNLFEYKNFSICDNDYENISEVFDEACDYIDYVDNVGGKVLVHCFEGKSRSATVVLAYLMLRKGETLSEAWNLLKKVHRRAQPNDGFANTLLELDRRLHGRTSMQWQHSRPSMKVCPICGKNAGLSTSSLKLHLQKSHKKLSSGSVDSAMTIEIQRIMEELKFVGRGGSVSPQRNAHLFTDFISKD